MTGSYQAGSAIVVATVGATVVATVVVALALDDVLALVAVKVFVEQLLLKLLFLMAFSLLKLWLSSSLLMPLSMLSYYSLVGVNLATLLVVAALVAKSLHCWWIRLSFRRY